MSAGDKIECNDLDSALEQHEALTREGFDVDFEYKKGCKVVLVLKGQMRLEEYLEALQA